MKRFILLSLFTATSLLSSIKDVDLNLENLTPAQLKKIEELSEISKKITQKQGEMKKADDLFEHLVDVYPGSYDELVKELNVFVKKFEESAIKKSNVKGLLARGFSAGEDYSFDFIKVFLVRCYFERLLVAELVKQYEEKLQSFFEL